MPILSLEEKNENKKEKRHSEKKQTTLNKTDYHRTKTPSPSQPDHKSGSQKNKRGEKNETTT
jgi:hypothetical protein